MKNFVLLLSTFCLLFANSSPCDDELYVELKKKNINEMSDREYEYFINKDKQCNEYRSPKDNINNNLGYDKISDLQSRKRMDLLGFLMIWGITIGVDASVSNDMTTELLVPGIGPFIVDDPSEDYEVALYLSGMLQTAFLIDFFRTSSKVNEIKSGFSYYINPNPVHPTITVAYNFK